MKKNDGRLLVVVCSFRSWCPVIESSLLRRRVCIGICWEKGALAWEGPLHPFLGTFSLLIVVCPPHPHLILGAQWLSALSWEGGCAWEGGRGLPFPWRSGAEKKALRAPDPDVLFVLFGCPTEQMLFSFYPVNWGSCVPAHCSCDCMRAHAVRRLCDCMPRRLPFLACIMLFPPGWVLYFCTI